MRPSPLLVAALMLATGHPAAGGHAWVEGEKPAALNHEASRSGWGNKHFLSGEAWLQIAIDEANVEKKMPDGGIVARYDFALDAAGKHEVWARIGYEFARSPFEWRTDGGAWATVKPDELTTDLMELAFFTEVAWLKLAEREFTAGKHTLEIRLPKTKDAKGKFNRVLFALDALCIHAGPFRPHSRFQPGEDHRTKADEAAAKHVFKLPEAASPARSSVAMEGTWEIARHDEQSPGETAEPIRALPEHPRWSSITVPGDKNVLRPDLIFAHRVWYRTRVEVPKSLAGRSFHLVFPQNNLNTTVFVNGVYCGFDKNPFARVAIDVTKGVKPGVNEVWVGIKDAWYGYSTNPKDPMKLRRKFNLPIKFSHDGFQDLAYPIWNHFQSGILVTPEFVAAGPAYATDVFVKPSVAKKELAVEVTVANRFKGAGEIRVMCEAVNRESGKVEAIAASLEGVKVADGAEKPLEVSTSWKDPKLWWPDDPRLYTLRTTVFLYGKPVDVSETTFGFREWTTKGKDFLLNGVPWHGWADTHTQPTREAWLAFHRKTNQKFMRFWGTRWMGLEPEKALDFFDRSGVVVRRSNTLDGEAIGYNAVENDPLLKKESPIKMDLMRNWRDQVVAQVKGERNHPSVMLWSIENEWLYINCINLHGGLMDQFEAEVTKTSDAVRAADPTRPTMVDGGGATKANTLPVHGDHYTTGPFPKYPTLAYDPNTKGGGRGRWEWDQKRPRFIGEELFAQGHDPKFSYFGGEEVFLGQVATRPTVGLFVRMLTEGYRWSGNGAVHFWQMQDVGEGQYDANAPRAVFCRQWDWSFASGQTVKRTFGVFNDTRSDEPIDFTWTLKVGGKEVAKKTTTHKVPAGHDEKFDAEITMPTADERAEGELTLILAVGGKEVFRAVKAVSALPDDKPGAIKEGELIVHDPHGSVVAFLKGVPFTRLESLDKLPAGRVLVIGKDALTAAQSASSALAAFAAGGGRVVVMEQRHPLKYQAIPAAVEAATNEGRIAFPEDATHPAFAGLMAKDFFTWGKDEVVYRDAYLKPTRGAKSLVQCDELLRASALVEVPVGEGLMLLCQLRVGETLEDNVVARRLLSNLIEYAANYKLEHRPVAAAVGSDVLLTRAMDAIGLRYTKADGALEALKAEGTKIAIVRATPANLKALAESPDKVKRFTDAGGWIVLNGLAPDGLAAYNKLVGYDHMIRPFRRERVTFPTRKHPLTAGLSTGDLVLYSSKQIFPWQAGNYVASDVFGHVVDHDEVAAFAQWPSDFHLNLVNGFVSADGWPLIVNLPAPPKPPMDWLLKFPKEQELTAMEWVGNTFYYPVTKVELLFDGKPGPAFDTKPNNDPQRFEIDPPRKGKDVTVRLADWEKVPGKSAVTGADNIRLWAKRPPEFYKRVRPMLNIGAMMEYPRGEGGIVLCNLLFLDKEEVPANVGKKNAILAALLRNLRAPFAGRTVVAGARLKYEPVDLSKQANQYRGAKGWFGDAKFTFDALPTGKQLFGGVPYTVYDFATSPVPTVVMLGGPGVPNKPADEVKGIPVGRKADAVFFLHAARIDRRRNGDEVKKGVQTELFRYVVRYADGGTAEVPVYAESDVEEYRQKVPAAIPGAQVAWVRRYEGSDLSAVAYSKQWINPRPEVAIESIGVTYPKERHGVPAVIAITTATGER